MRHGSAAGAFPETSRDRACAARTSAPTAWIDAPGSNRQPSSRDGWTRVEIMSALASDCSDGAGAIAAADIESAVVGPDLVQLTYVSDFRLPIGRWLG